MAKKWSGISCRSVDVSTPMGCLPVYVGPSQETRRRYVIQASHLAHPLFRSLLNISEAEFGFQHQGGLTIPCHHHHFERVLSLLGHASKQKQKQKVKTIFDLHPRLPPPRLLCSSGMERGQEEGSMKLPLLLLSTAEGFGSSV